MKYLIAPLIVLILLSSCKNPDAMTPTKETAPGFTWDNATVYFLLTDRFNNGDPSNDTHFDRTGETGELRGFMGGDIKGITQKIREGYFSDLGVNAIWFTPVMEQIHGSVDEGTGNTYAYHGYWIKDWTALDPNFGSKQDLQELVAEAHKKGIRILLDVVMNHTGPVTPQDPFWGDDWARQGPQCTYDSYEATTSCTLVANLPDFYTDKNEEVELPEFLLEKWKKEGRYEEEMASLQAFFDRTGYPKAPRYYLIKWLSDYVETMGIDGFRVDTAKHTEAFIWQELYDESSAALDRWRATHPEAVLDSTTPFYMVGEVYNYSITTGRFYDYGDQKVDFFANGFHSLINFDFKHRAQKDYESIFAYYDSVLNSDLKGKTVLNYLSSHDDGAPFDPERSMGYDAAVKLLLSPGGAQIYYGDELNRPLTYEGAQGDANLRTFMNWDDLDTLSETQSLLSHWQKLGKFRNTHPAIGAGRHQKLEDAPYTFSRILKNGETEVDAVLIALETGSEPLTFPGYDLFKEGSTVRNAYTGEVTTVKDGTISLKENTGIVLLESYSVRN